MTTEDRFWSKVDRSGDCWIWQASTDSNGYGQFFYRGSMRGAHRAAYEMFVGPVPEGMMLDHLCRTRNCVRTGHLEVVTNRENTLRGISGDRQRNKTHCPQGHEYSPENTYTYKNRRSCKECSRKKSLKHYHKKRAEKMATKGR